MYYLSIYLLYIGSSPKDSTACLENLLPKAIAVHPRRDDFISYTLHISILSGIISAIIIIIIRIGISGKGILSLILLLPLG